MALRVYASFFFGDRDAILRGDVSSAYTFRDGAGLPDPTIALTRSAFPNNTDYYSLTELLNLIPSRYDGILLYDLWGLAPVLPYRPNAMLGPWDYPLPSNRSRIRLSRGSGLSALVRSRISTLLSAMSGVPHIALASLPPSSALLTAYRPDFGSAVPDFDVAGLRYAASDPSFPRSPSGPSAGCILEGWDQASPVPISSLHTNGYAGIHLTDTTAAILQAANALAPTGSTPLLISIEGSTLSNRLTRAVDWASRLFVLAPSPSHIIAIDPSAKPSLVQINSIRAAFAAPGGD